jgi:hypothetical protein
MREEGVASSYVAVVQHEQETAIGGPDVASLDVGVNALDSVAGEERSTAEERGDGAGVGGRGVATKCDKTAVDRTRSAEFTKARLKSAPPATGDRQDSDNGKVGKTGSECRSHDPVCSA